MLRRAAWKWIHLLWAAFFLSGCGGGGGSSGQPPEPTTSGLVPEAPALGDTLYADATTLRPLVPSGVWTYRGYEKHIGDAQVQARYTSTTTHQAVSAGAVVESATNPDNSGLSQQNVVHRGGAVMAIGQLDLGNGQLRTVEQVELRSPVRVGDQYTALDLHLPDSGFDVDGDRRNDALDFAVYTQVVGKELVDVQSFYQAEAVRTTTFVRARIKLTSNGAYVGEQVGMLDVWYVAGVGVVKRRSELPGDTYPMRLVTSESLVSWDGLTRGVGFLDPKPAVSPAGARLTYAYDAIGFDTHAVLMTQAGAFAAAGVVLSKVDSRGTVQASTAYSGINAMRTRMVRVADGVRLLAMDDTGLYLRSFNADGTAETASPTLLLSPPFSGTATNEVVVPATVGDTIWLAWIPYPTDPAPTGYSLQVQPFNSAGQPLAAPTVLTTVSTPAAIRDLAGVSRSDRAGFTWLETTLTGGVKRYVLMEGAGAQAVAARTLSPVRRDGSTQWSQLGASSTGYGLVWLADRALSTPGLRGLTFDSAGLPLPAPTTSELDETQGFTLPWQVNPTSLLVAGGDKLYAFTQDIQKLWPDDATDTTLSILTEFTPGGGPLATNNQARVLARGVFPSARRVAELPSNVLTFADEPDGVTVTSVWRRR
ncbi:MAG: hypothetical protein JSR38_16405 [Proteobacteria bacterium]|nr:hypothetical protein [Pseudomonadota bacterium]